MFLAFAHQKIGRWNTEEQDAITRDSEDALTAMIIGRLRYLPPRVTWCLLVACADIVRGTAPAEPRSLRMAFWPRMPHPWEPDRKVEPDVVWEDETGIIVIEAKWNGTQSPEQIDRECAAVMRAHPAQRVTMLALGGVNANVTIELRDRCRAQAVLALGWDRLADAARALRREEATEPFRNVLEDVVSILEWRGLRGIEHLKTFDSLPRFPLVPPLRSASPERAFHDLRGLPRVIADGIRHWRPCD